MSLLHTSVARAAGSLAQQTPVCLIHIGYHRTGTSFLQVELFPLIPDSATVSELDDADRIAADTSLRLAIMTQEALSSDLDRDRPELAAELARRFPSARIFIGIRSQYSIMRGVYHLYVKAGGTDDYETFVKARCGRLFDYARLVTAYRAAFGVDNVFVMRHEDLARQPVASMQDLLRFAGADPDVATRVVNRRTKPSAGDPTMTLLRLRNRIIAPLRELAPSVHREILYRGLPGARVLDRAFGNRLRLPADRVRPAIREAYAESNARLFASLKIDGAAYDYPLPDKA